MGSKHLMAAVADELSQQQRWLAHYQVAEKRHARRVMRPGGPASAGSRAPRADAGLAAARFAVPARGALGGELRIGNRSRSLHHDARRRHGLHRLASSARLCSRASPAQVARSVLGVDHRAVTRPRRHARAMGVCGLGMDERACGDAGARIGQGRCTQRVVARSHIARARRRALAWPRQNFATDQGAFANSRAQCASRRPHRLGMDRRHFACARRHSAAMVRRGLDMDSPGGADLRARFAEGNAAGIAWTAANASTAAVALQRNVSAGAAWSGANARAASRATLAAASASYSWAALHLWGVSLDAQSATPPAEAEHRALVVRRCTALVCVEQKRVHLPMIRAN